MRPLLSLLALLPPLLCACPSPDEPRAGLWADFDVEERSLLLGRDDVVLLRFDGGAIQLGTVPSLDDDRSYDPYWMAEQVTWHSLESAEIASEDEGGIEVDAGFEGGLHARLSLVRRAEGRFEVTLVPSASSAGALAFYRLFPRVDPTEGFYGLGGVLDSPEHRGRRRAIQMEVDEAVESFNNEAHASVPFLIGTTGWGLFVQDFHPMTFDVATSLDDRVEVTVGTGTASGSGLRFHLYAAEHPLDVTRLYYETTGEPRLPARWALGPWIWRDEVPGETQVRQDMETIRDLDLATTGYWIDRPYASAIGLFDFDPARYADPGGMIEAAHDLGFRMALWHVPYAEPGAAAETHDVAQASGFFPPETPGTYFAWSWPVDFTNEDARAWWQGLLRTYTDLGIEGWKLDYAEDVQIGINGGRYRWRFADGSDERTMHHRYQLLYHQVYAETLPLDGGFLLCRTGTWGDQVNGPVIWPGDLDATMDAHGAQASDDGEDYVATGGLPASLAVGLSLGPSGFPFYGSDTGGYRHAPPDKETFTRWFEQTALSSVMQVGTNSSDVPWEFTQDNGFDEEMLGWYRDYARLHLRLFPYEWTLAQRLVSDGRPIMRPLGLARPEMGVHPADVYFFGDDLLVAPVVERGAVIREIPLPDGEWADWSVGEVLQGGTTVTVDAPLEKLPLLMARGAIVPLLRPTIDAIAATGQPERVDSMAVLAGVLWPRVFAGPASAFDLYDGARIGQEESGASVAVTWRDGAEFDQGAIVELVAWGPDPPSSVALDGTALQAAADLAALESDLGWLHSPAGGGSLWIAIPGGEHRAVATR